MTAPAPRLPHPDLRCRLKERTCFGLFVEVPHPAAIELAALAGWDFVVADCEHAPLGTDLVVQMVRAGGAAAIPVIVRVATNDPALIQQALDAGASGVQVPQIASFEEARRAVAASRFHPAGLRGFNPFVRASSYGYAPIPEFFRQASEETTVVLQIETRSSFEDAGRIAALDGVDVLFIGPYDLSQSLGVPGEVEHPVVVGAIEQITRTCLDNNIAAGIFTGSESGAQRYARLGIRYLCYSVDMVLFGKALKSAADRLKDLIQDA